MSSFPKIICRVRAIYPFHSDEPSSLSFDKDDYIDVLAQLDSGWWDGWCGGSRGWFPSNYVEVVEDNLDSDNDEHYQPAVQQQPAAAAQTNNVYQPLRHSVHRPLSVIPNAAVPVDDVALTSPLGADRFTARQRQERRKSTRQTRSSLRSSLRTTNSRPYSLSPPATIPGFGWTSSSALSNDCSDTSLHRSVLPDGWSLQVAEDGTTYFYYNHRTGKMQYEFPGDLSGSDDEYESLDEFGRRMHGSMDSYSGDEYSTYHEARESMSYIETKMNRLSIDSLPANVEASDTALPDSGQDILSQWVERVTPQGRPYYCNLMTQETTWDYDEIDKTTGRLRNSHHTDSEDEANVDARRVSFKDLPNDDEPYDDHEAAANANIEENMSWEKISSDIATAIHRLNAAAQRGDVESFTADSSAVVVVIRMMFYASRSLDRDSATMQDRAFHAPQRAVMTSLSKLVLSVKTASEGSAISLQPELLYKVQRDAGDVLAAVRSFVAVCQEKNIQIEQVQPQLLVDTKSSGSQNRHHKNGLLVNAASPTHAPGNDAIDDRKGSLESSQALGQKAKYALNQDLIVSLQTHANQIYGSTDAVVKASKFLQSLVVNATDDVEDVDGEPNIGKARSNVVLLFRNLSMQIGQYLTILEDIDLASIEGAKIPSLADYRVNKQNLYNSVGILFSAVQSLSNERNDINQSVAGIESATQNVDNTIGSILTTIEEMVEQRRRWYMQYSAHDKDAPTSPVSPFSPGDDSTQADDESRTMDAGSPLMGNERLRKGQIRSADERSPGWWLGYDYAPEEVVFSSDGSVKGGTLPALVERLTLHDTLDTSFIATFLLTYRSFCTTEEFLSLLEQRYNLQPTEGLTPWELHEWTERKQKLVRLRVFNVMKTWLENYYNEEDEFVLGRLEFFTNTVIRDASSFAADQLNRLIRKRRELDAKGGLKKLVPNTIPTPLPIMPKDITRITLLDIDPVELARQLTIMDFKLYSSIRPIECLNKAWSREDTTGNVAKNVKQSIDYCNRLTCWVSDSILANEEAKKRVTVIKHWAQVANRCRMINNYNTCMAIISAFDNSAIGRLRKTWELVGNRTNQSLGNIRKLMGANRNFTEYREMIHSVNPPCIPFLGIYLQDLTFIEDGNPDYIKKSTKLINFAKRQKAAEVIREINQFQSPPYNFQPVPDLQAFIRSNLESSLDIDKLYERSLQLEPRETTA